jgi:hypothetical protein
VKVTPGECRQELELLFDRHIDRRTIAQGISRPSRSERISPLQHKLD